MSLSKCFAGTSPSAETNWICSLLSFALFTIIIMHLFVIYIIPKNRCKVLIFKRLYLLLLTKNKAAKPIWYCCFVYTLRNTKCSYCTQKGGDLHKIQAKHARHCPK